MKMPLLYKLWKITLFQNRKLGPVLYNWLDSAKDQNKKENNENTRILACINLVKGTGDGGNVDYKCKLDKYFPSIKKVWTTTEQPAVFTSTITNWLYYFCKLHLIYDYVCNHN